MDEANIKRIEDLLLFDRELLERWRKDCPNTAEYLEGHISALEIVLALIKG